MSVYKENAPGCLSLTHSPSLPELGSNTVLHNDCQTPEGKKRRRFGRLRLRKRKPAEPSGDQADTLSLCSISSLASISSVSSIRSVKSKTPLSRVTAHFAHLVASSPPIRALKRTFDGENSNPSKKAFKRYHSPEVKYKPREKKCWVETIENSENFSTSDIKRQEAIHELVTTEEVMRDDLTSVVECMFHPLKKITLLTAEEHSALFGCIDELLPLHKELIVKLKGARSKNGIVESVGQILLEWLPKLRGVMSYYTNLGRAKSLYDYKKRTDPAFVDFLDRCRLSSFSHRLEVWDFLDAPRSLLMKYPLLIGEIMNRTSADHPDLYYLKAARESVQEFVEEVDHKAGEAECDEIKKRLYFCCNDDNKMCQAVVDSRLLIYYGTVKNTKGSKLTLYLLDKSLVVARPATRNDTLVFQVSKEPIPVNQLLVEDVNDGEVRQGGSIRNTLNRTQAKHVFRVIRHHDDDVWESQTLLANSEHDKKAWLAALKSVMLKSQPHSVV